MTCGFRKCGAFPALMFVALQFGCICLRADEISNAVTTLQSAQPAGKGSVELRAAVKTLSGGGEKAMLPILTGFKTASPLAANWLRNAFEAVVSVEAGAKRSLPAATLEAFITDSSQSPIARRLAYETLKTQTPGIEGKLIPGMLLDPSSEFRRDAVALLIEEATKTDAAGVSTPLLQKALSGAVHEDQVKTIAEALKKNGETINIQRHFGFIPQWSIVGPFDNKGGKGFATAFTPESEIADGKSIDGNVEYDGQLGKVQWKSLATEDDFGVFDIAKQIENYKGSLMYARTQWSSSKDQNAEVRLGTPNAWKLWVNGKLVFEREEYHRSVQMDQYTVPVSLKAGENTIVLKVCQNEQEQEWAQRYQFQLRICDNSGSAILPQTTTAQSEVKSGATR